MDNGEQGITIDVQSCIVLSNAISNENGYSWIYLYYLEDSNIHDCIEYDNRDARIHLIGIENSNLTNVIVKNNT